MQQAKYIAELISLCSDQKFGQDSVEWFILTGQINLSWDLQTDLKTIVGEPGFPETGIYDRICDEYRSWCRRVRIEGVEMSPEQAEIHYERNPNAIHQNV